MDVEIARGLLTSGVVLLSVAGLLGFVQARQMQGSAAHTAWRVVHAGGTAGAVQLIGLSAVWPHLSSAHFAFWVGAGVSLATWAFFLGPLLRALGADRGGRWVNLAGAVVALPSYCALPLLLL